MARIFRAAAKARVSVNVTIDPNGKMVITTTGKLSEAGEASGSSGLNPWDEVLNDEAQQKRSS